MKNRDIFGLIICLLWLASCKDKAPKFDASGAFEAVETIVSAQSSGKLLVFNVEEGQVLDSGHVIGYIDSTQLHLNRLQLQQNKRAILSGRPQTDVQVEVLRKDLASLVLDRDRTEKLVRGGVASQKQLDDANLKVAAQQARIKAQESSLQTTTTNLIEQSGTVDQQLQMTKDQLDKCMIVNQVKGTVLTKYAEPYEMALQGSPLYKIADLSSIILRAYITGDQLHQVKLGQQVDVFTDDGNGGFTPTKGLVTWINDKSEFTPKTIQTKNERSNLVYAMKVLVKNDGYLKIGMYGEVNFTK